MIWSLLFLECSANLIPLEFKAKNQSKAKKSIKKYNKKYISEDYIIKLWLFFECSVIYNLFNVFKNFFFWNPYWHYFLAYAKRNQKQNTEYIINTASTF